MGILIEIGQIGDGAMAPKETSYNGKPFRRCGVWVDDPFGEVLKDENDNDILGYNGKPQKKRQVYQLIFSSDESGKKLFENLAPGRKIQFMGRLSHRPRCAKWNGKSTRKELLTIGDVKIEAFENATVHVMRVEFVDPSLSVTLERYKKAAMEKGLSEEEANKFVEAVVAQMSNRGNAEAPDNESASSGQGQEVPPSEDDSEDPPF